MAVDFDGTGDFYSVTPTLGDPFTLMGWFRADTLSGFGGIFSRGNTTNQMLLYHNAGVLQLDVNAVQGTGSTINTGQWYHICVQRGEAGANVWEVFLDGVSDFTATNAVTLIDTIQKDRTILRRRRT